ncbi:NAD-dependent epimerase/dehydratase family protein [Actinoallomurus iriomotensis]|uniref:dTDP-glucose 4,6-dehydratase n=1 Tax=Actinoallomurus iriomotensis TaxID=478107 RepID=A0A9W6SBK9_9ACTN|nr:NAD(P)-dependent oxidoreductase [Actinoallomurus iriomotensis]GLY91931.1 dTDP-glucose 4,6-dehydratase [Actinoallomurus iriomotensis]
MHVLIAGGTGVLGRRIIPLLIGAGHRVTALTRTTEGGASLLAAGAEPALADVYDAEALTRAVRVASPDVVMHQLTDLSRGDTAANARIRVVGTRNLVDAARQAGVPRIVAQSIAWVYEPGERPAAESVPLDLTAPEPRRTSVGGVRALETAVRELPEWVILRYGALYGPGTWYAPDGMMADRARGGGLTAGADVTSFVHADDAAEAAVRALTWPSAAVNICDDEPAPADDWAPVFAAAVGASPPAPGNAERQGWARGADNSHAREALGWTPRHPSWREGFAALTP